MPLSSASLQPIIDQPGDWQCINDPVMGGESTSEVVQAEAGVLGFRGRVSLANGGGFASARVTHAADLSGATGLMLRAQGPVRRYRLTLFTEAGGRISYRVSFWTTTQAAWHYLPFARLRAMRRGRVRADAPPFDPSGVRAIGFLIGDKQAGDFALHVHAIAPYGCRHAADAGDSEAGAIML